MYKLQKGIYLAEVTKFWDCSLDEKRVQNVKTQQGTLHIVTVNEFLIGCYQNEICVQ